MNDTSRDARTVQMALVNPGSTHTDGDFAFSLQPRFDAARTVKFALIPSEAEALHRALGAFLKEAAKSRDV